MRYKWIISLAVVSALSLIWFLFTLPLPIGGLDKRPVYQQQDYFVPTPVN